MSVVSKHTQGKYMYLFLTKSFLSLRHQLAFNVPTPTAGHPTSCEEGNLDALILISTSTARLVYIYFSIYLSSFKVNTKSVT
jgi:hypothetical protein